MENKNTVIEEYMGIVYTIDILVITGACMCAGVTFIMLKLLGFYPAVSWIAIGIFVLTCVLYFVIGCILIKNAYIIEADTGKKMIRPDMLRNGKLFVTILMFIQFNFISYLAPSKEFWAYAFFFVILAALFLDVKMVSIISGGIVISLIISSIIRAETILPAMDAYFIPELVLRIICVVLSLAAIVLITFLTSHYLVNVKKDEMETNNARVQNVIAKAGRLMEGLVNASSSLSEISQNESASAQELTATSESLLANSNELITKAQESMSNLNELKESGSRMNRNVEKVEHTSKDLLHKSEENEQLLNQLKSINEQVIKSTNDTNQFAAKLGEAVKEIDVTLNVISEISESTNLLALNASIEAARAGEAGKGFAVVAQEVGKLASNTQDSLIEVQGVISKIQDNVKEMTLFIEENTENLENQSEMFIKTFGSIQEMIVLLQQSMQDISGMNEVHKMQEEVIQKTVLISENIAESIQKENQEFTNISEMVESNTTDILQMTDQIDVINNMVEEMNELLSL